MTEKYIKKIKKNNVVYELINAIKQEYKVKEIEAYKILVKEYNDILFKIINKDIKTQNIFFISVFLTVWIVSWIVFKTNAFYFCIGSFLIVYSTLNIKKINLEKNFLKLKKEFETND